MYQHCNPFRWKGLVELQFGWVKNRLLHKSCLLRQMWKVGQDPLSLEERPDHLAKIQCKKQTYQFLSTYVSWVGHSWRPKSRFIVFTREFLEMATYLFLIQNLAILGQRSILVRPILVVDTIFEVLLGFQTYQMLAEHQQTHCLSSN